MIEHKAVLSLRLIRQLRRLTPAAEGVFGFWIKGLASELQVSLRADEAFPAASVIKLPILLAALEKVRIGATSLDATLRLTSWHKTGGAGIFQHFHDGLEVSLADACLAMIALSDNTATNLVIDVAEIGGVNSLLDGAGCRRTRLHRYFGKPDMPGPMGPSQAVPQEIGRLLELLWRRELLTPELCDTALLMLRRQTHRALIPRLLPQGTAVAHKTGSLDGVRHDVGLFWPPRQAETTLDDAPGRPDPMALRGSDLPTAEPVVFVALSKGAPDLRWTVENRAEILIARAARLVYQHVTRYSSASSSSSSSSSSPPVTDSRIEK